MRKINVLLFSIAISFLFFISASGQNVANIDSLERKVAHAAGRDKAIILYELVYSYLRVDVKKAGQYIGEVKQQVKNTSDDASLAYLKMALGIFCGRNGFMDSALFFLSEAKENALAGKNDHALMRIYASLGHTYISSGHPENGIESMFAGLRVTDRTPDIEMEMKLRTNIAWAYLELKQYRNCISHGLQNLRVMEGSTYEWIALYTYNNVAISYGALGLLDSARYFIDKGIAAAKRSNDVQSLANGYFILGTIYSNAGEYDLAIVQYLKAKPYREKVGNPLFIVSDQYAISELYYKAGKYQQGVEAGHAALAMAEKYNLLLKFEGTYHSLARNYEGLNDFRSASKYYRLWAMAKDSVYRNANISAIEEVQAKYESEKKEQQLALQRAQLAEQNAHLEQTYVVIASLVLMLLLGVVIFLLLRSRQRRKRELFLREAQIEAALQSQETERRRFARDLHDGMGQLISALRLALHGIDRDTSLDERVAVVKKSEDLLNDMHREIRSIAFNLMPQTLVQSGLVPALREMSARLNESGRVSVRVTSFDVPDRLAELYEISLYRIIQEWISNICKHARASTIEVQLIGHESEISIIIEDNGSGFDTNTLQQSPGNGWKNMKSRVSLMKGVMDIDSMPGKNGTTLIIKLPVAAAPAFALAVAPNTQ
jgi:signal transduction histidine kinase/tetratricopeptide (TPR) repeat protein